MYEVVSSLMPCGIYGLIMRHKLLYNSIAIVVVIVVVVRATHTTYLSATRLNIKIMIVHIFALEVLKCAFNN